MSDDRVTAPCAICGEEVAIMEAMSGPGRKPVHRDCFDSDEVIAHE